MRYRIKIVHDVLEKLKLGLELENFSDMLLGTEILNAIADGRIKMGDTILMLSLDGAQLFQNKESDCWIYIWVILDHSPDIRYKKEKVLVGAVIPGPNKPKNLDSFLFPGIHHLSALQREGLPLWDAKHPEQKPFVSHPFFAFRAADGPGMTYLNGLVGHVGRMGCRLFCGQPGRRKGGEKSYYPAKLRPDGNYDVAGCAQPDHPREPRFILVDNYHQELQSVLQSSSNAQYERRRLHTGISRPSLFLGLPAAHTLQIPRNFVSNIMHLGSLNLTDLLINLWHGKLKCDANDNISSWTWATLRDANLWNQHGSEVAAATPYLPGSFGRPPRNPAKKINSGYKAWEFVLYFYGLGPAVFLNVLPFEYWRRFCKLVYGMRVLNQHSISKSNLFSAHESLLDFTMEYEELYYQRKAERIHFVRPSIHSLSHLAQEVPRTGPPICTSQWTMERAIGYLTFQICQLSTVYANLSAVCLRQCQINALVAIHPELLPQTSPIPSNAVNLGGRYFLLSPKDKKQTPLLPDELTAVIDHLTLAGLTEVAEAMRRNPPHFSRWARLSLPNGQVAQCAWKENRKPFNKVQMARNVKIIARPGACKFAEVQYFLNLRLQHPESFLAYTDLTVAVVRLYSPPDRALLSALYNCLWSTQFLGDAGTAVFDHTAINSVVGMVPHTPPDVSEKRWFVVEKPGLDIARMAGTESN